VSDCSNPQHLRLLIWITNLTTRLGDRIFAKSDLDAAAHGWQVRRTGRGLGRSYRDPRFDQLVECSHCAGAGFLASDRHACSSCGGTGRLWLDASHAEPEAP